MAKLTEQSIFRMSERDEALVRQRDRDRLIQQGRSARKAGIAFDAAPPFVDSEMTADWQTGWQREDDEILAAKAK